MCCTMTMPSGKLAGKALKTCSRAGGPPVDVPIAMISGRVTRASSEIFRMALVVEGLLTALGGTVVSDGLLSGSPAPLVFILAPIASRTLEQMPSAAEPEVSAESEGFSIKSTAPRASASIVERAPAVVWELHITTGRPYS